MKTNKPILASLILLAWGVLAFPTVAQTPLNIQRAALLSYQTVPGVSYQLETSNNLGNTNGWVNYGPAVQGTGSDANTTIATANPSAAFRVTSSGQPALTPSKIAQINQVLTQALQSYAIPGILAGVKIGNYTNWTTAVGVANLTNNEPLGADYRFRIGSASKSFVAMTVLALINEGKLNFETPAGMFLSPAVTNALSQYNLNNITIRMLLEHTSGIENYTDNESWLFTYTTNRTKVWSNVELLTDANQAGPPVFSPGDGWFYSNSNYVLLGLIVEALTGHSLGDEITARWLVPLQLNGSYYPKPGDSQIHGAKVAHGYMDWQNYFGTSAFVPGYLDVTVYDPTGVGAAGAIVSTCGDLLSWVYNIGHSERQIGELMTRGHLNWLYYVSGIPGTNFPSTFAYGMGLAHESDPNNNANYDIVGHRGQISGYDTSMQYLPLQDTAIVVVCNRSLLMGYSLPSNSSQVALNQIVAILYPDFVSANTLGATEAPKALTAAKTVTTDFSAAKTKRTRKYRNRILAEYP